MKTHLLAIVFAFCTLSMLAQSQPNPVEVKLGDSYTIGAPVAASYQHLEIPRANIIRKRGGMFNQNELKGLIVVVTDIKEKKDGTLQVTIQPKEGIRFFGSHRWLKADLNASLESGELMAP